MPSAGQLAQDREQPSRLALVERRVGLVEDEHPRPLEQHAAELDELALADRQPPTAYCRVDVEAEPGEDGRGRALHRPGRDEAEAGRLAVGEQVGEHRALREEAQLLVDDADAEPPRASAGDVERRPARRRARSCRLSGRTAPARIFISVDLPAPFSPTTAWIGAGSTSRSMPAEGDDAAVRLRRPATAIAGRGAVNGVAQPRPAAHARSTVTPTRPRSARPSSASRRSRRRRAAGSTRGPLPAMRRARCSSSNVSGGRPNGSIDAVGGHDLRAGIEEAAGSTGRRRVPRMASASILTGR